MDDDPVMRRIGVHALGAVGGMSVVTAADGTEALAAIDLVVPDAILMDFLMPGMDGDEMLSILQSSPTTRDIPVVFLTGVDDDARRQALLAAGAVGCLGKPFDPMTLASELVAALRSVPAPDTVQS